MAATVQHPTLPSFAQAFSNARNSPLSHPSPSPSTSTNALPPIQTMSPPHETARRSTASPRDRPLSPRSRKRVYRAESSPDDSAMRIKEEQDELVDETPARPRLSVHTQSVSYQGAPSASSPPGVHPSLPKKRRITITGLNTNLAETPADPCTTPISPVVMGLPMPRDDPNAIEQVRSMLSVKQKQKAIIEQRRGSIAGYPDHRRGSNAGLPSSPPTAPSDDRHLKPSPVQRDRTPQGPPGVRPRGGSTIGPFPIAGPSNIRPPTPPSIVHTQSLQPVQTRQIAPGAVLPSNLPAPPGSFARRRASQFATGGKRKPADIMINPREGQAPGDLAPAVQSAPPVPGAGFPGRFPVSLPSLPSVMPHGPSDARRAMTSRVPPTPTSLTSRGAAVNRSPPSTRTVPISTTLVPPTPTTLRNPGYAGEKAAFLAPFEMFYDALADSKELKTWLAEQLQKSNALIQALQQQQDRMDELVSTLIDRRLGPMREECYMLHRRVAELEEALRHAKAPPNGAMPPDSYTFPAPPRPGLARRISSPLRTFSATASPVPFEASRRHSVSSARFEPPRSVMLEGPGQPPSHGPQYGHRQGSSPLSRRDSQHPAPQERERPMEREREREARTMEREREIRTMERERERETRQMEREREREARPVDRERERDNRPMERGDRRERPMEPERGPQHRDNTRSASPRRRSGMPTPRSRPRTPMDER